MAGLSNSIRPTNAQNVICRPVQHGEIEPALRLILASKSGLGTDEQVLDFLSFCVERKIDTNGIWIAIKNNMMVWSLLPVPSPGRTMMLFTPTVLFTETSADVISALANAVGEHFAQRGVQLCQMLIDPHDRPVIETYRRLGFEELAELVYLQRAVRSREPDFPQFPTEISVQTYSRETHLAFSDVVRHSYEQSLDCPALNGMRDMDDVIAGHQATGEFDPKLWCLLQRGDQPLAVLLLARLPQGSAIELVYLGLTPEARGKGIGDLLMQQAMATVIADGRDHLSLAVDALNQPALRLYYRHGMKRIGSRIAMLRDLRSAFTEKNSSGPRISTPSAHTP